MLDYYYKFEFERLSRSEVFQILRISSTEDSTTPLLSESELQGLVSKIEYLNPSLIFLKNATLKQFRQHKNDILDGRLIFFKDGYKYGTLLTFNSLENQFTDIEMVFKNFYKRPFYYRQNFEFVDSNKNVIRNLKTGQYIILDEEILSKRFFIQNKVSDHILLMQWQIKRYFNLDLKNIKLDLVDDTYFIFLTKDSLIIKIFEDTTIDRDFIIRIMKQFRLDFLKLKDFVFIDGYLKICLKNKN